MRLAVVGCGYIADLYLDGLSRCATVEVTGVHDLNFDRADRIAARHGTAVYRDVPTMLADDRVDCVAVLTNPDSHADLIRASLEAGKHVYTEKPLALDLDEARDLVALASARGLRLASAPCSLLGEAAQTIWRALREERIGTVRLAYAELDDGMVHRMAYEGWRNGVGTPWPYQDEFEQGVVLEHAGYGLSWLTAFFGPVAQVAAESICLVIDKPVATAPGPDFSVAFLTFTSGVVARLTCSAYAPVDRSLRIFGDEGSLWTRDCWDYGSEVYLGRPGGETRPLRQRVADTPGAVVRRLNRVPRSMSERYPLVRESPDHLGYVASHRMDFARGIVELAEAIEADRPCRLSAEHALHITEVTLAIHHARSGSGPTTITSRFEPIEPMSWAS